MARAPHNVLVLPYRRRPDGACEYAVFRRSDDPGEFWQSVAGGLEDEETAPEAARRELVEETGLSAPAERWIPLDTKASVPVTFFRGGALWGPEIYVVQVHAFGVDVTAAPDVALSHEHIAHRWLPFAEAERLVRYESNKIALWELNERLARAAGC
jgi:dATP pyrophosphohydrolase